MESGTTVLRDIHGLDTIPWWPLATGWWYLVGLVVLLLLSFGIRYWLIYNAGWLGWRGDARRQLRQLKKALASEDAHTVAGRLSELLRRIAMVRSGRQEAAGLTGDIWLQWLAEHDNTSFDWERHGQILLTAPYMPPTMSIERKQLLTLIRAATRWIDASRPAEKKAGLWQRLAGLLSGAFGKSGAARV
ncbi:MAG: DUF4381 domain-containing protein [Gammaproteobacteria bacterium]|jgi:hypothetical protein|nr:DUF4381 domain-containing protein [Gammaproteobacteria bacterium]